MKKNIFCEECRKEVTYSVKSEEMKGKIKGEIYHYKGKKAFCGECGSSLYIGEINDYNLDSLHHVFREKNEIISLEKILEIPKKYDIGKRPLSLLLGWGELTFSRYCDGDVPTRQYSEQLKKIYDSPEYYVEILEKNKKNLNSERTYKKSKDAVDLLMAKAKADQSKMDLTIDYLLYRCEDITPLALQKGLYYIQGFYYAFNGAYIFEEDCEAWVHGPVYRDVYMRYRNYQFNPIESSDFELNRNYFSEMELSIFDSVIKNLCCYSGKILENFTHKEMPWIRARGKLSEKTSSNIVILKEHIGQYFQSVKEKYNMIVPNDIKDYAQEMFKSA